MRIGSHLLCVILVLWLLTGAAARAQDGAPGSGSITGRVTIAGKPAAGVILMLVRESTSASTDFYPPLYQRAGVKGTTDADGMYSFEHLAGGNYLMLAGWPAYVVSKTWREDWLPSKQFKLADGEMLDKQDFALVRGGVITGRVTDEKGHPVAEQIIQLNSIADDSEHRVNLDALYLLLIFQGQCQTDDRGVYRIYGLPSGRYTVSTGGPRPMLRGFGVKTKEYQPTYYPGVIDKEKASSIEVKEGDELTGIDIRFGQAPPTYKAAGRVVDATTGKPVADAVVNYGTHTEGGGAVMNSQPALTALTNEKGEFQIKLPQPGKYAAYADFADDSPYFSEYADFEIATADLTGVTIRVHRGQTVSGTAIIEGGSAADLASLAGLGLAAGSEGSNRGLTVARQYEARLGPDAAFRLTGVQPGKLIFYSQYESGPTRFTLLRLERGGIPQKDGLKITAGENINDVRVVLAVNSGVIRGGVKNAGELSLKDVRLTAVVRPVGNQAAGLKVATVGADGQFKVEGLLPGEYEIIIHVVNGDTLPLASERVQVTNDKETTVSFTVTLNKEK